MNILLLSSYLPYPLFSGGHVRLYNILKELSYKHEITLVCEKRNYQTQQDINEVKKICKRVLTFDRRKQWSWQNIIKTGFSTKPFLITGHTNSSMKKAIKEELLNNKFDLIHVETFYVMQNLPDTTVPIVLAEQNIEYLVYERFVKQASIFLRPLLMLDVAKIKYWEEKFWKKAEHIVVTAEEEKKIINRVNVTVVANGVDLKKFKVQSSKFKVQDNDKTILFIGDFRWIENRDAAEWLLKKMWPLLKLKIKSEKLKVKLWVVGKNIPEGIKKLGDATVIFDEKAPDDTREIFAKADLLLAPIRVGGGGKFKILESMASGVPVVTTSIGVEGIAAQDNNQVLIGDNIQELVDKTVEVLTKEDLYQKISQQARKLIEEKYDWKIIVKKLENVYQKTVA